MKRFDINPLRISGAAVIDTHYFDDQRGIFARLFDCDELGEILGPSKIVNTNFSHTRLCGSIRGFHFQYPPHSELKLMRCLRGELHQVILDLRQGSKTYLEHVSVRLSRDNMRMSCVPEGCASCIQTLEDDCELIYFVTAHYAPDLEGGIRFDDPLLGIHWPLPVTDISQKDRSHPYLDDGFRPVEL